MKKKKNNPTPQGEWVKSATDEELEKIMTAWGDELETRHGYRQVPLEVLVKMTKEDSDNLEYDFLSFVNGYITGKIK